MMVIEGNFFERLSIVQDIVRSTSSPREGHARIREFLQDPDLRREFFSMLGSPEWIDPLVEVGVFDTAPPPVMVKEGIVRYSPWPESQYLARMAREAPARVADVFVRLHTDNAFVIGDMLDGAANMPAQFAAHLAAKICAAHESGALCTRFVDAAELCARLAREGEPDAAMILGRCLFAVSGERDLDRPKRRDDYSYFEGLNKAIGALVAARTKDFLEVLFGALSVVAESKSRGGTDPEYDGSPWWRPAIEEHGQNRDYDFGSRYVGCVREALEIAIRDAHMPLGDALRLVESYRRLIFKRLRLHLINTFADRDPAHVRRVIMDHTLFENYRYKHEYAMLCGRRFPFLNHEERAAWLGWIDAGPDMSDFDERVRQGRGREATEEDRKARIEYWQFEKLHWIRDHLDGERLSFYQCMLSKHGVPELADLNVRHSAGFAVSESPFGLEEFTGKGLREVVDRVTSWRPEAGSSLRASVEGVARTFKEYLAREPEKYAEDAELLQNQPAIYVRTYLEAVSEAVARSRSMNLSPTIELCKWVIDQGVDEDTSGTHDQARLEDEDWQWTRDCISEFVRSACGAGVALHYRERFWGLIVPLTGDKAESYIVESSEADPRVTDFAILSLNSPCGKGMRAVFAYARWVADSVAEDVDGKKVVEGGFDRMPEVRELLEAKLGPDDPGGFLVRATYGWFWPWINWIDREWLARHAERICDLRTIEEEPEKAFGWAAWNTFLVGTNPHIEHYELMRRQFSYGVDQAATIPLKGEGHERPFENLGEHLIILYGRGQLGLEDDDAILQRLLKDGARVVRTHAIEFVGESLWREDTRKVPDAVKERFVVLWDWYWRAIGQEDARSNPTSGVFGYWFVSGVFDPLWALDRLEQFVRLVPKPEPDSEIVEKLAEVANVDMPGAVRILGFLVDGDDENWRIHSWKDHARKILASAMEADGGARDEAVSVIDRLGRRGFVEFGELLKE